MRRERGGSEGGAESRGGSSSMGAKDEGRSAARCGDDAIETRIGQPALQRTRPVSCYATTISYRFVILARALW